MRSQVWGFGFGEWIFGSWICGFIGGVSLAAEDSGLGSRIWGFRISSRIWGFEFGASGLGSWEVFGCFRSLSSIQLSSPTDIPWKTLNAILLTG